MKYKLTEIIAERFNVTTQAKNNEYNLRMDKIKYDFQLNDINFDFIHAYNFSFELNFPCIISFLSFSQLFGPTRN